MARPPLFADKTWKTAFASRLAIAMQDKGLDELALANTVRANREEIEAYVRGERSPSIERLIAIHRALDVTVDWLIGEANTNVV